MLIPEIMKGEVSNLIDIITERTKNDTLKWTFNTHSTDTSKSLTSKIDDTSFTIKIDLSSKDFSLDPSWGHMRLENKGLTTELLVTKGEFKNNYGGMELAVYDRYIKPGVIASIRKQSSDLSVLKSITGKLGIEYSRDSKLDSILPKNWIKNLF